MNMRRKLAIAAVVLVTIPVLALVLLMMFASPDRYRETLIAEVAEQTGAALTLDAPLQWQLWPTGIQAKGIKLLDAQNKPLLQAEEATAFIKIGDLLKGNSGISGLSLQQVDARVDIAEDGSSNWDTVLDKIVHAQSHALDTFDIRKMRLTWHTSNQEQDIIFDDAHLAINELASNKPLIEAEFLTSRQDKQGGNLLLQNTFKTRAYKQKSGWLLKGSRLTSILSSTYIPGQSSLDLQADFEIAEHTISSPGFRAIILYKNMNMPQPEQAILTGSLNINAGESLLTIGNVIFKSSGKAASQLKAKSLAGNWKTGELSSQHLSLATFVNSKEYATPKGKELSLSCDLTRIENGWQLKDILVEIDESRLHGDLTITLEENGPHYVATLAGQGVAAADIAILLKQKGIQGTVDFKANLDATGSDIPSLLENGQGNLSLKLTDGRLTDLSIPGKLWERLENARNLLPDLAESSPVSDNTGTNLKSFVMVNKLENGIISTKNLELDAEQLTLKVSGEYDVKETSLSYTGQLNIEKSFFNNLKKPYVMPIECVSTLNEENLTFLEALETNCGMTQEAKRETLTNALRQRFLDLGKEARKQLEQSQQEHE